MCVSLSSIPHCAESESLESRLACADAVRQLCVDPAWCKVCVLFLRLSSDCKNDRLARSSSRGEAPSSSTSAISAKVTGWVLNRASRARLGRFRPRAIHLGTGRCWGNSSMADAKMCAGSTPKPTVSIGRAVMGLDGWALVFGDVSDGRALQFSSFLCASWFLVLRAFGLILKFQKIRFLDAFRLCVSRTVCAVSSYRCRFSACHWQGWTSSGFYCASLPQHLPTLHWLRPPTENSPVPLPYQSLRIRSLK